MDKKAGDLCCFSRILTQTAREHKTFHFVHNRYEMIDICVFQGKYYIIKTIYRGSCIPPPGCAPVNHPYG